MTVKSQLLWFQYSNNL